MIYLIVDDVNMLCKIGYTNNPNQRLSSIQTSNPYELTLMTVIKGDKEKEQKIHKKFQDFKVKGEWFNHNEQIQDYFLEEHKKDYPNYKTNTFELCWSCVEYMRINDIKIDDDILKTLQVLFKEGVIAIVDTNHDKRFPKKYKSYIMNPFFNRKKAGIHDNLILIDFRPSREY